MFGFLGGRNRKRQQVHDNADRKNNNESGKQLAHGKQPNRSAAMPNDYSFDDDSLDMSLYTTPSKATLQYHRGAHNLQEWQSVDSAVTPEVASVQSRLGGWEAPPPPAPRPPSQKSIRQDNSATSTSKLQKKWSDRSKAVASSKETTAKRFHIVGLDTDPSSSFYDDNMSIDSNIRSAGPVDVDSLELVGNQHGSSPPADNFSDLFSTFEAQSLAGRMAPNTAATHHERQANVATTSPRSSSAPFPVSSRPSYTFAAGTSASHVIPEDDSPPMEFGDDARSLVTEVSGLTMLTMEQHPVDVQSQMPKQESISNMDTAATESFGMEPNQSLTKSREVSRSPRREREARVENGNCNDVNESETRESPPVSPKASRKGKGGKLSKKSKKDKKKKKKKKASKKENVSEEYPLEDVSFSGLFSTIEAESLAGRLDSSLHNLEGVNPDNYLDDEGNSFDDSDSHESVTFVSETPTTRLAAIDAPAQEHTAKRSNVGSKASDAPEESVSPSRNDSAKNGNASTFSRIVSAFEARSASSNGLEPPATKRLLPDGEFPLNGEDTKVIFAMKDDSTLERSPERLEAIPSDSRQPMSPSDTSSIHTIDDESTIPPPPLPDDFSWNEGLWSPPSDENTPSSREALSSVDSLAMDEMSTFSLMERIESNGSNPDTARAHGAHIAATSEKATAVPVYEQKSKTTALLAETSLEYSESADSSLQYSDSTAPPNVVSDIPSLLASAETHRNRSNTEQRRGPIDLDEAVTDTCSDTSSLYGTASLPEQRNETPVKSTALENVPSVSSPLNYEDDEEHPQFLDDDDEEAIGTDGEEESYPSRPSLSQFDEALVERSYKETMESLSSRRHDSGSILLTEKELNKHAKSTQFKEALPSSSLKGYDEWKRKQFEKQKYFAQIHKTAMKRKEQRERLSGSGQPAVLHLPDSPSLTREKRANDSKSRGNASMMERSSTIQTSRSSEPILRRNKTMLPTEPKRRWSFLRGKVRDGDTEATSHQSFKKSKSPNKKKKKQPAVVTLEDFMRISNDEPDDASLVNMRQSGFCGLDFTVNSVSLPAGETAAATKSHYLGDPGIGPRLMALQHLEIERAKNIQAEKDKTKLEIREQRRIALLKERELERQRRLNSSGDEGKPPSVFKSKGETRTKKEEADQFLHRNLSFGTTNTAGSSIRSPSCVLSPCIVCNAAERSHMAQPCNHFYYCQDCALKLQESASPVCPVCSTTNVTFSRVYA